MQLYMPSVVQAPVNEDPELVVPVPTGVEAEAIDEGAVGDEALGEDVTTEGAAEEATAAEVLADGAEPPEIAEVAKVLPAAEEGAVGAIEAAEVMAEAEGPPLEEPPEEPPAVFV